MHLAREFYTKHIDHVRYMCAYKLAEQPSPQPFVLRGHSGG